MFIHENLTNYRVIIYQEDLIQIGKTVKQIIDDLIEASHLINKPLSDNYKITEDPRDRSWVIFLEKEYVE